MRATSAAKDNVSSKLYRLLRSKLSLNGKSLNSESPIESCSHATLPETTTQAKLSERFNGGSAELPFEVAFSQQLEGTSLRVSWGEYHRRHNRKAGYYDEHTSPWCFAS